MEIILNFVHYILEIDTHLASFVDAYGFVSYALIFLIIFMETGFVVTPFLPGDSLLFAIGSLAALDVFSLPLSFVLLCIAAVSGDTLNYWIGDKIGKKAFSKNIRFLSKENLEKTQAFYKKHGGKTIILARFVPIVRTFAPFVAGVGTMKYSQFISYNIFGGVLWVSIFLFSGYFFGNLEIVKKNFEVVIIVIILISVLPIVFEHLKARKNKKLEMQATSEE